MFFTGDKGLSSLRCTKTKEELYGSFNKGCQGNAGCGPERQL